MSRVPGLTADRQTDGRAIARCHAAEQEHHCLLALSECCSQMHTVMLPSGEGWSGSSHVSSCLPSVIMAAQFPLLTVMKSGLNGPYLSVPGGTHGHLESHCEHQWMCSFD